MGKKWYGSITNRIDENKMYTPIIKVGTPVTEYLWSDREPYEVTKVISQKHIFMRRFDYKATGAPMSNTWELISNPNNPDLELRFRYGHWYQVLKSLTGKTVFSKMNVSFGIAEKYYDYEF